MLWMIHIGVGEMHLCYLNLLYEAIMEGHLFFPSNLSLFDLLIDIVLYLCEKEHVEGGMIFQLLEDLTEMSTMRNCEDIFGYIESKQDILGKVCIIVAGFSSMNISDFIYGMCLFGEANS